MYICLAGLLEKVLTNFDEIFRVVCCVTSKNRLDFGDNLDHVNIRVRIMVRIQISAALVDICTLMSEWSCTYMFLCNYWFLLMCCFLRISERIGK